MTNTLTPTEWEQMILGCMMMEPGAIQAVIDDEIHADMFTDPTHKQIFLAIRSLHENDDCVDILTVQEELITRGFMEPFPTPYLIQLTDSVPAAANIRAYIQGWREAK